jgi:hypothetical protein
MHADQRAHLAAAGQESERIASIARHYVPALARLRDPTMDR